MKKLTLGFLCLTLLGGCSTTYEPNLILPPSELTRSIDANVEVHPLIASDDLTSGHSPYGVDANDYVNQMPPQLTQSLTQQVVTELSVHHVFRKVSTYDPAPDLILTGRVEQFFEHDRRKPWTLIPGMTNKAASLFGANSYKSNGEVLISMNLHKPTGELVGSYVGHSKFNEDYTPNSEWRPGYRLNRGLAEAVAQIRDAMLADAALPKARVLPPVSSVGSSQ